MRTAVLRQIQQLVVARDKAVADNVPVISLLGGLTRRLSQTFPQFRIPEESAHGDLRPPAEKIWLT